jgi:MFS family permease
LNKVTLPFYGLTFLSGVVWLAIVPLVPAYARTLSLSKVETGMVLAAAGVATLVMSFPIGVLADRVGARALTIGSSVLVVLSCLGQGLAADFWALLAARAVFGVALGTIWTAGIAWISDASSDYQRSSALGIPTTVAGLGIMVGPGFAGLLAGAFGVRTPYYVLAAASAVVTLALVRAPASEAGYRSEPVLATLRSARRDRFVVASCAVMALIGLLNGGINLLAPLELNRAGLSAGETGLVFSAASGIFVLVSAKVTRFGGRAVTPRVVGSAALLYAATLLVAVLSGSAAAIIVFLLLRAPFWSTLSTLSYPLGALGAHGADLGRGAIMGLLNLVWGAASAVGPLAAGGLAQSLGERWVYALLFAWCTATGIWLVAVPGRSGAARDAPEPVHAADHS